jgi:hypothetical protein
MATNYVWHTSYRAALLETDRTKLEQRIQAAESEIHSRRLILSQDHLGTDAERAALVRALQVLRILQTDATRWVERNRTGTAA